MIDQKNTLIEAQNISCSFNVGQEGFYSKKRTLHAVRNISFSIFDREVFGLVGESGCGKTTTGKMLLNIIPITGGSILYRGKKINEFPPQERKTLRQDMQLVFQDPFSALNPRMIVGKQVLEILDVYKIGNPQSRRDEVKKIFSGVGLPTDVFDKYPHQLSGGQLQRVVIARSLIMNPHFLVCDEPVSSLDVSIQAQVVNLLVDLHQKHDLTYLFISHDLKLINHICDRIAVMYVGEIIELAEKKELFETPKHPYTRALIAAAPVSNPRLRIERNVIEGEVPSLLNIPKGCAFHSRCPFSKEICKEVHPELEKISDGHWVSCHRVYEI